MSSKSRAAFPHSGLTALKVIAEILAVTACSHRASDLSAPEHNTHGLPLQPLGDVCDPEVVLPRACRLAEGTVSGHGEYGTTGGSDPLLSCDQQRPSGSAGALATAHCATRGQRLTWVPVSR